MNATFRCPGCGKTARKERSKVNRARRDGFRIFCSRKCAGVARRVQRSEKERKRMKAQYDAERRARLREEIAAKKREYFQRNYDPAAARKDRKKRSKWHTAYCREYYRDPIKKRQKEKYDIRRRGEQYGDFIVAWRLLIALEKEIRARCPDKYERQKARGYFTHIQERKHHERQDRRFA